MHRLWIQSRPIAQSAACLNLVPQRRQVQPTGRLPQPSIPLWVSKISTRQMMAIGGICAFQIGSLCQLGNQDMAALVQLLRREFI